MVSQLDYFWLLRLIRSEVVKTTGRSSTSYPNSVFRSDPGSPSSHTLGRPRPRSKEKESTSLSNPLGHNPRVSGPNVGETSPPQPEIRGPDEGGHVRGKSTVETTTEMIFVRRRCPHCKSETVNFGHDERSCPSPSSRQTLVLPIVF